MFKFETPNPLSSPSGVAFNFETPAFETPVPSQAPAPTFYFAAPAPMVNPHTAASVLECRACNLRSSCRAPVPAWGTGSAGVMIVGEAPGMDEDNKGLPLIGASGRELDMFLTTLGVNRIECVVTNVVHCRPLGNADPEPHQIAACAQHLHNEINRHRPKLIIALGAFSARALADDFIDMDSSSGALLHLHRDIVRALDGDYNPVVIPTFHPAFGLRSPRYINKINAAFVRARHFLLGTLSRPVPPMVVHYSDSPTARDIADMIVALKFSYREPRIFIDTETKIDGSVFCWSIAWEPHRAFALKPGSELETVLKGMLTPEHIIGLHNAKFDYPILREKMGFPEFRFWDSMVAAYVLQTEPLGLKPLAHKYLGVRMTPYSDVLNPHLREEAMRLAVKHEMFKIVSTFKDLTAYVEAVKQHGAALGYDIKTVSPSILAAALSTRTLPPKVPKKTAAAIESLLEALPANFDILTLPDKGDILQSVAYKTGAIPFLPPGDLRAVPWSVARDYSARDADTTLGVSRALFKLIEDEQLSHVMKLDSDVIKVVLAYQRNGVYVDRPELEALRDEFVTKADHYRARLRRVNEIAGGPAEFNPDSPVQLAQLLYDRLGFPGNAESSTSDEYLQLLKGRAIPDPEDPDNVFYPAADLMELRQWTNYAAQHCGPLLEALDRSTDGRVHAEFDSTRTETGRLASRSPNILNVPARTKEGKRIRRAIKAAPGFTLIGADYSQIELRLLASESGDEIMCKAFIDGRDLHSVTACMVFNIPTSELDNPEFKNLYEVQRSGAKVVNFGIPYGVTGKGLRDQLHMQGQTHWTEKTAQELIDYWFHQFSGVRVYFDRCRAEASATGFISNWFGRRRPAAQIRSYARGVEAEGVRLTYNAPIQSGAGDIIKHAMLSIHEALREYPNVKELFQFHDALYLEAPDEEVEAVSKILKEHMESATTFKHGVPLKVDLKVGKTWGDV